MSKPTPGPWTWDRFNHREPNIFNSLNAPAGHGFWVIELVDEGSRGSDGWESYYQMKVSEADAALIVAAPDLLSACQSMVKACNDAEIFDADVHDSLLLIEAAIARAEGRS